MGFDNMQVNTDCLMRLYLKNRDEYKRFTISKRQVDIVNYVIASFKCFSVDVAENFGISVQSASTQLKRLCDIGYLERSELSSESGGIEFEYSCRIKQRPAITICNTPAVSPKNKTVGKGGYIYYHD